jgi:hypothetical protein
MAQLSPDTNTHGIVVEKASLDLGNGSAPA